MKFSQKLLPLFLLLLSFTFLNAQEEYQYAPNQLKQHSKALKLTDEQTKALDKLLNANTRFNKELYASEKDYENDEKMKEMHKKSKENLARMITDSKNLLTDKQIVAYKVILKKHQEEREQRRKEYQKRRFTEGAWAVLDLTDEQVEDLITSEEELKMEMRNNAAAGFSEEFNYENMVLEKYATVLSEEEMEAYKSELERIQKAEEDGMLEKLEKSLPLVEAVVLYYEDESYPKYQLLRSRLERKIDAPDKMFINELRASLNELFELVLESESGFTGRFSDERFKSKLEVMKEYILRGVNMYVISPYMLMGLSSGVVADKEDFQIDEEAIVELCEKYNGEIEEMTEELKDLRKEDRAKLMSILSKDNPKEMVTKIVSTITMDPSEMYGETPSDNKGRGGGKARKEFMIFKNLSFLLMKASEIDLDGNKLLEHEKKYNVYPSPSNGVHTLELNLIAKNQITIELLDSNGKVIQVPFSGELEEGQHVMNYDWTKVEGHVFYYRITGKRGTESIKFIINR